MEHVRAQRLLTGTDDPFAAAGTAEDLGATAAVRTIPRYVTERFAGRWVLLRGHGEAQVVADADDLEPLLQHPDRRPTDVTAFVRDPARAYG